MWIMLIQKLPTEVSPPKLSILWSTPWPDGKNSVRQIKNFIKDRAWQDFDGTFPLDEDEEELSTKKLYQKVEAYLATRSYGYERNGDYAPLYGNEPNWVGARAILYKNQSLRVFPHEFSILSQENMAMYIGADGGEAPSHELVASSVADAQLLEHVFQGDARDVYDAALVDGCVSAQATAMALGVDVSEVQAASFPAIGWYRCRREYAEMYCHENEMAE
jgi:hypothetical protein